MRNARKIASEWHGGQWTELYRYGCCDGPVTLSLLREVRREYNRLSPARRTWIGAKELRTLYNHLHDEIRLARRLQSL